MLNLTPIPAFQDNYFWLIQADGTKSCAIVDPGLSQPVLDHLEQYDLQLCAMLITHHHQDHTGGIDGLLAEYDVPVYGPAGENIHQVTELLMEGDKITVPELQIDFQILDVPGHTAGHIAYYTPGHLFCGDTLFSSGCGRLFEGTAAQLHQSLQKLATLPDDTKVYCAHEYTRHNLAFAQAVESKNPDITRRVQEVNDLRAHNIPSLPSTIGLEKQVNPFLRCHETDVIAAAERHAGCPLSPGVDVFASLRHWKDSF